MIYVATSVTPISGQNWTLYGLELEGCPILETPYNQDRKTVSALPGDVGDDRAHICARF